MKYLSEVRDLVQFEWNTGGVHLGYAKVFGATTLCILVETLNVEIVTEALRRYGLSQGW